MGSGVPKAWADSVDTRPSFGPSSSERIAWNRRSGQQTDSTTGSPATEKHGTPEGAGLRRGTGASRPGSRPDSPGDRRPCARAADRSARRATWRNRPASYPGAACRSSSGSRPGAARRGRSADGGNRGRPYCGRSGAPAACRIPVRSARPVAGRASPRRPAAGPASPGRGCRTTASPGESRGNMSSTSPVPRRSAKNHPIHGRARSARPAAQRSLEVAFRRCRQFVHSGRTNPSHDAKCEQNRYQPSALTRSGPLFHCRRRVG